MANPLDIVVDSVAVKATTNTQRSTINPVTTQLALALQSAQGQTAIPPTVTVTEPVIVTQITQSDRADNLGGGLANQIPVQTAANTTGYITAPQVSDRYLRWNGNSIEWAPVNVSGLGLATVAVSGAYTDLTGTPTLATVATTGSYTSLSDQPTLATGSVKTLAVSGQTSVVLALDGTLTLVAGNAITITTNNTTKAVTIANNRNVLTVSSGLTATYTLDCTLYNTWQLTLTASTATAISVASGKNPPSGQEYEMRLYVTYAATSSVTWSLTGVKWPNGVAPTQTGTAGKTDVFAFTTLDGGTTWWGIVIGQNW